MENGSILLAEISPQNEAHTNVAQQQRLGSGGLVPSFGIGTQTLARSLDQLLCQDLNHHLMRTPPLNKPTERIQYYSRADQEWELNLCPCAMNTSCTLTPSRFLIPMKDQALLGDQLQPCFVFLPKDRDNMWSRKYRISPTRTFSSNFGFKPATIQSQVTLSSTLLTELPRFQQKIQSNTSFSSSQRCVLSQTGC